MKFLGKFVLTLVVLGAIIVGGAVILPGITKNRQSQLAMAIDNVNPLVTQETVYASTSAKPVRQFIGGAGEKEYTYRLVTYNTKGEARTVVFDAQWRLKPNKFLAITTKGQNVESWKAIGRVPANVQSNLAMS